MVNVTENFPFAFLTHKRKKNAWKRIHFFPHKNIRQESKSYLEKMKVI